MHTKGCTKLKAGKEWNLIWYPGLGWEMPRQPWTQAGKIFVPSECFHHCINVVLPFAGQLNVPLKPPLTLLASPDLPVIDAKTSIDMTTGASCYPEKLINVTKQAYDQYDA